MRGVLAFIVSILLFLYVPDLASAQVVRFDGPFSWCSVENKSRSIVRCDHVFPLLPESGPAYHTRWTIVLNATGGTRCITWEVYHPSIPTPIARQSFGRAC